MLPQRPGPCTPAMEGPAAGSGGRGYNEALLHKVGPGRRGAGEGAVKYTEECGEWCWSGVGAVAWVGVLLELP